MFFKLILAFTLIPILELYLLIELGRVMGSLNTVILVITTGVIGAYLARLQGMRTMLQVRSSLQQGRLPTENLLDALLIFIAGLVLLTPGLVTDAAGLALLFPLTRKPIKDILKRRLRRWIQHHDIHFTPYG